MSTPDPASMPTRLSLAELEDLAVSLLRAGRVSPLQLPGDAAPRDTQDVLRAQRAVAETLAPPGCGWFSDTLLLLAATGRLPVDGLPPGLTAAEVAGEGACRVAFVRNTLAAVADVEVTVRDAGLAQAAADLRWCADLGFAALTAGNLEEAELMAASVLQIVDSLAVTAPEQPPS